MPDPYIGEIRAFPYTYAPEGWLECDGQVMPIMEFQALYAVIGLVYGEDGRSTFRLPNLNGRAVMGSGQGPGLDLAVLGEYYGENTKGLNDEQLPPHSHGARAELERSENASPSNGLVGILLDSQSAGVMAYKQASGGPVAMAPDALQAAGGGQLYDNRQPYQAFRYCICADGVFPSRP